MSEFIVYGVPGSPYVRSALAGLEEKGAPYRLAPLAMGEAKSPAYLARQPFGRIPCIEHDGFTLYETQAILRYLDALFPEHPFQPADPKAAARMNQIVGIFDWYFFPKAIAAVAWQRVIVPNFFGGTADEAIIADALPDTQTSVKTLADLLGSNTFLAGESLTIADLMLGPQMAYFAQTPEGQAMIADTPLAEWLDRMEARPSFQATTPERLRAAA
jgi:glutathione S-transferase